MEPLQLRDIHLPDANLWWPLAPGWWISLLLILALVLMLPRLWRWWRRKPVRSLSLRELERIRKLPAAGWSDRAVVNEVATLLRRVTISYCGRQRHAATTGAEWTAQLQALVQDSSFTAQQLELLSHGRYRADCGADIDALLQACEHWLRALPRSKDHVSA